MHPIPAFACDHCGMQLVGDKAAEKMRLHEAIPVDPDDFPVGTTIDRGPTEPDTFNVATFPISLDVAFFMLPITITGTSVNKKHIRTYSISTETHVVGKRHVNRATLKRYLASGLLRIVAPIPSSPG